MRRGKDFGSDRSRIQINSLNPRLAELIRFRMDMLGITQVNEYVRYILYQDVERSGVTAQPSLVK